MPLHRLPASAKALEGVARRIGYTLPVEAILAAVEPYEIHGTRYYRIAFARKDEPDKVVEMRVAAESIYRGAKVGDRVEISMLMGTIDDVKKL
jgi:hypothetical protein